MAKRLLIAAGGTGGHMFPARAAADALIARGWEVQLVTDARGARHAKDFPGRPVSVIEASSPFVKNLLKLPGALMKLGKGLSQARSLVTGFRPDVVAGFGGYPAFPALAAARLSNIPYIIHEQNSVLGRVNRVFARGAAAVASGFERLDRASPRALHIVTGNPVRGPILSACQAPYTPPDPGGEIRLLVLGGSLGARILSDTVPKALSKLPEDLRARLAVTQQAREEDLQDVQGFYERAGIKADLSPFFEEMGALYADAHLVISRAGASSVSEVAAVGRPAIFVPLAIAMDDHQTANAHNLMREGAAESVPEREFTPGRLCEHLARLLPDGEALSKRAEAARRLGKPDAHERLADLIE
ncbi:MAG: undecaprenyldiphospho-muramoylpentapeptide beta-N-acetylglucosaminyltransferase, partial [Oceanicaulis sp.]